MGSIVLLDLMGGVALLLWGLHMVLSGVLRALNDPDLRRHLSCCCATSPLRLRCWPSPADRASAIEHLDMASMYYLALRRRRGETSFPRPCHHAWRSMSARR